MKSLVVIAAVLLGGCSGPRQPTVLASTPAMVTVCARDGSAMSQIVETAQEQCAASGRNAELMGTNSICSSRWAMRPSWVHQFRCVQ